MDNLEGILHNSLRWMPRKKKCCGKSLYYNAKNTLILYLVLGIVAFFLPIIGFTHHHTNISVLAVLQWFPAYLPIPCMCVLMLIDVYLLFNICLKSEKCDRTETWYTNLFIFLALIASSLLIIWGLFVLIRMFADEQPGFCLTYNVTSNPYKKESEKICDERDNRGRLKCHYVLPEYTDEEKKKMEEWNKEHENDVLVRIRSDGCDFHVAILIIVANVCGMVCLIGVKSFYNRSAAPAAAAASPAELESFGPARD